MNERLQKIINHPATIPTGVGLVSLGVGLGIGYILGRRSIMNEWEEDYEEYNQDDVPSTRPFGLDIITDENIPEGEIRVVSEGRTKGKLILDKEDYEKQENRTPSFVVELLEKVKTATDEDEPEEVPEVVTHNVFAEDNDGWNYDIEQKKRSSSEPYVLHKDEFYANELDYSQLTLTYYEGDNFMSDEDDKPVYGHSKVVGPLLFGHGSGDPNVFYVRNDKLRAEYEILHEPGLYSLEVLGYEIEDNVRVKNLEHSRLSKFKEE